MKTSCWLVAGMCLAGLLVGGCATSDQDRVQGMWAGHQVGRDGPQYTMIVSDNTIEFRSADDREWYKGTFTLDDTPEPKTMDFLIKECVAPRYVGETAKVIYKIEKATLTFAGNEPGVGPRPAAFEPVGGSRVFVLTKEPTQN